MKNNNYSQLSNILNIFLDSLNEVLDCQQSKAKPKSFNNNNTKYSQKTSSKTSSNQDFNLIDCLFCCYDQPKTPSKKPSPTFQSINLKKTKFADTIKEKKFYSDDSLLDDFCKKISKDEEFRDSPHLPEFYKSLLNPNVSYNFIVENFSFSRKGDKFNPENYESDILIRAKKLLLDNMIILKKKISKYYPQSDDNTNNKVSELNSHLEGQFKKGLEFLNKKFIGNIPKKHSDPKNPELIFLDMERINLLKSFSLPKSNISNAYGYQVQNQFSKTMLC